nr:NADH dehydrogenase subunit 3 [Proechinophthirus fluctus]
MLSHLFIVFQASLVVVGCLWGVSYLLSFKTHFLPWSRNEAFECGFESAGLNRIPFSVFFYTVGVLFLVFDIELVISMPIIFLSSTYLVWVAVWSFYCFLLLLGLLLEALISSLDWHR